MRTCREIQIQEEVTNKLLSHDISPYSVIFTYACGEYGTLSISLYIPQELDELLNLLDYKYECDKSGYLILKDNTTLVLTGQALLNLFSKL